MEPWLSFLPPFLPYVVQTVEGDPQLMTLPIIAKAVSKRLTDESISVREASVSLVGSYVVQYPAVANSFQPSLLACLGDAGVSVRKRAIRIFQDILTLNPRYKGRSVICDLMLKRAEDPKEEDGVRDLVHDLFRKLLLEDGELAVSSDEKSACEPLNGAQSDAAASPIPAHQRAAQRPNQGVVTPTPPSSGRARSPPLAQKRADLAAQLMMEVVRTAGTNEHLESLLKTLLRDSEGEDEKSRKKGSRKKRGESIDQKQCERLVLSLFELLVSIEEQKAIQSSRIGKDLAATLQTIEVLTEFAPDTVRRNLDTLLPFLQQDKRISDDDEASVVGAVCDILHRLTTLLGSDFARQLSSNHCLGKDLSSITYRFGAGTLESAIRTWSTIIQKEGSRELTPFSKKFLALVRTFYGYLQKKIDVDDFSNENVSCSAVSLHYVRQTLVCRPIQISH